MINWIKKYWAELLTFISISAVMFIDQSPNMTWINTNSDGVHLTYAAKYLYPAHKGSAPLYLLWQHLMLYIPIGTDYWKMALMSVIPTIISSILIYFIVKLLTGKRIFGIASSLVFGSSALVISQAIIVKYYPLVTMIGLLAYWLSLKKKWNWVSICLGAAGAIHPISLFFIGPMVFLHKELRSWKNLLISGSFILFYLYIPITNRPPYMWDSPNSKGLVGFITDTLATAQMLSGGLSIWDFPKRIIDTILQLGLSFNIGIIVLGIYIWRVKHWWKDLLFWMIALPIMYYVADLAPQTYVYMLPSIGFGAIAIGLGLNKIGYKYDCKWLPRTSTKFFTYATIIVSIGLLVYNANYFDIGRTLDKNLSATEFYTTELPKVPDGHILIAQQGWEWAMVYPYDKNESRNIIPVNPGSFASINYQNILKSWGIKFEVPSDTKKLSLPELQDTILKSILDNNTDLYISIPADTKTYGASIVPYKGNEDKVNLGVPVSITDGSMDMKWNFRPSNPYDITTGTIEVTEWVNIVFSNYTVLLFTLLGTSGGVIFWIGYMMIIKKKKWSISKVKEEVYGS